MENASTKVSLASHSVMVKEIADHLTVVLFAKDNIDADKPGTMCSKHGNL